MAAKHTFGREAVAVYLAAALVVLGTWTASRYLILRKFENIEQNDVARSVEVMRKALVTKNTEIETVSRDFARWDDMYSYVSSLDPNFEYQNFSEAGLDEMNVDVLERSYAFEDRTPLGRFSPGFTRSIQSLLRDARRASRLGVTSRV